MQQHMNQHAVESAPHAAWNSWCTALLPAVSCCWYALIAEAGCGWAARCPHSTSSECIPWCCRANACSMEQATGDMEHLGHVEPTDAVTAKQQERRGGSAGGGRRGGPAQRGGGGKGGRVYDGGNAAAEESVQQQQYNEWEDAPRGRGGKRASVGWCAAAPPAAILPRPIWLSNMYTALGYPSLSLVTKGQFVCPTCSNPPAAFMAQSYIYSPWAIMIVLGNQGAAMAVPFVCSVRSGQTAAACAST